MEDAAASVASAARSEVAALKASLRDEEDRRAELESALNEADIALDAKDAEANETRATISAELSSMQVIYLVVPLASCANSADSLTCFPPSLWAS